MKASVRTVGFAQWDPELVILLCTNGGDMVHLYPVKGEERQQSLEFSEERRNIVLLTNADRRYDLTHHAEDIYRLVVFGPPEQLSRLGVPVMDMVIDDGPPRVDRQQAQGVRDRIESEAVSIDLTPPSEVPEDEEVEEAPVVEDKKKEKQTQTLRDCMEAIAEELEDSPQVNIKIMLLKPTLGRLTGRTNQRKYQEALRELLEYKTVKEKTVKVLFRWIEGIDGLGPELSDAVKSFGKKDMTRRNISKTAEEFGITPNDLFLVLVNQLPQEED